MTPRKLRSFGLFIALAAASVAPFLVNCAAPEEEEGDESEGAVVGVNNKLGLGLSYDEASKSVFVTLKEPLKDGESLRLRVRRGKPELGDEAKLDCDASDMKTITKPASRENAPAGKVVYAGPTVAKELIDLLDVYNDHRFQSDQAWATRRIEEINRAGGPKALVEACITRPGKSAIRLQTNLEQAWDTGTRQAKQLKTKSINILAGDAGGGGNANDDEEELRSMEAYGEKCVQELGEIPFFKKLGDGKYDTFDCRDFVGTGEGHEPARLDGVEGSLIPLTADDQAVTKCDGEGPNGVKNGSSYNCVSKCDKAEFLSEGCEPGPTVTTAKNAQGSHWVLLCRKVSKGEQVGWTKTKKFDDIAMIGTNPRTGKTCFFQNMIGSGTDGQRVPHPADREKSRTLWDSPKGYCFESCHATDAFIQSPWINGAKRSNGKPIVPMMGFDPDFEISWNEAPYYVINMDAQGWNIPKQLVSEDSAPCATCHRVGGRAWMNQFANWTTGSAEGGGAMDGDSYWSKITDSYKRFEKSHWMPMRLDGVTSDTWATSKWGKAMENINKCSSNEDAEGCDWADIPRGSGNPRARNP